MLRSFAMIFMLCAWVLAATSTQPATRPSLEDIDARSLPSEQRFPSQEFVRRWRPSSPLHHRGALLIENLRIHDAVNQRAMDIALTSLDQPTPTPGEPLTFRQVIIRNCETANIARDEAGRQRSLHIDHIRITGGGNDQPFESELLLEDVYIHGGNAQPLIIGEGKFSRITLRRLRVENTHDSIAQITAIAAGSVGEVIIDDSPGLKLSLIGRAGSIKRCIVKDSPGAVVTDTSTAIGKSGAEIITGDQAIAAVAAVSAIKPATRPTATKIHPRFDATPDRDGKTIHLALSGELGEDVAYVTFEAADRFDYLLGSPINVTDAPWKCDLRPSKRGPITVRATIIRLGGDADVPIVATVQMP